jgi:hypothetical protein
MHYNPKAIERIAQPIINAGNPFGSAQVHGRRFRAFFGVTSYHVSLLWDMCVDKCNVPLGSMPKHLLWSLLFLRLYSCEHVSAAMCGCDEKTFRKWSWEFVEALGRLDMVSR